MWSCLSPDLLATSAKVSSIVTSGNATGTPSSLSYFVMVTKERSLTTRLRENPDFTGFSRKRVVNDLSLVTMTKYDSELGVPVAFPEVTMDDTLAEVASKSGLKQLHIAETEKYAHVTYF